MSYLYDLKKLPRHSLSFYAISHTFNFLSNYGNLKTEDGISMDEVNISHESI